MSAANIVSTGDLYVQVPVTIGRRSRAARETFNKMSGSATNDK